MGTNYYLKTAGVLLVLFTSLLLIPATLYAQKGEMPITTSSEEALNLFMDGRNYFEQVEFNKAAPLFEKAVKADPNFALAYLYRSISGGGLAVTRPNINKAVALIPKVSKGEGQLIMFVKAQFDSKTDLQKKHLQQLLNLFPSDKRVQFWAGAFYYFEHDYDMALQHLKRSVRIDNNYAPAYNLIGYCEMSKKNNREADNAFKKYISLVPDHPNPYDSYAEFLQKTGKFDESIRNYKTALSKDPSFVNAIAGIGDDYAFQGKFKDARDMYSEYYNKSENTSTKLYALYLKAVSFIHEDKPDLAVKTFDEYRSLAEKDNMVNNIILSYKYQGLILTENGKPDEGLNMYRKAHKMALNSDMDNEDKEHYKALTMIWRVHPLIVKNHNSDADKELKNYSKTITDRNHSGEVKDFHFLNAKLEMNNGNHKKSMEHLSKADQNNPLVIYHMALLHEKMGNKTESMKLYKKIAEWNNNGLDYSLVRKKAMNKIEME